MKTIVKASLLRASVVTGLLLILFLVVGIPQNLWAQSTSGSIFGSVEDATGAVVPGVSITVTNVDNGSVRKVKSGDNGRYDVQALPRGTYDVHVELAGFKRATRNGVALNVGQDQAVDFKLEVGETTQEVTVSDALPLVDTTSATVSNVVTQKQLDNIPLNARSFLELVPLQTGAAFQESASEDGRLVTKGFGKKLTVVGTRAASNSFLLDGADVNDANNTGGSSAGGSMAGVEAVAEFRVLTNAYDAEYGKHTGGVITAITKSGSNQFHGSAFDFLRNDNMDASNYFDRPATGGKPEFHRNQFGGSIGGPIAKNKTFFFADYEGLRSALGRTTTFNVPSLEARGGKINGKVVPINAAVLPFLLAYPVPNSPDRTDGTAQFTGVRTDIERQDYTTGRIDHSFSASDSIFGRFTYENSRQLLPRLAANGDNKTKTRLFATEWTHIFSPALLSRTHFSINRTAPSNYDIPLGSFPFPDFSFKDSRAQGTISVTNLSDYGGDTRNPNELVQNLFQYKEDLIYNRGNHGMKMGFQAQRMQLNLFTGFQAGGAYTFGSMSDFMQNIPTSFAITKPGSDNIRGIRQSLFGLYFQDDIKLTSYLSLNAGLRYEFVTTPKEVNGKIANIRDWSNPARINTVTNNNMDLGDPYMLNPSLKNITPRLGIAWDPFHNKKTSIRAGGGLFPDEILPYLYWFELANTPPYRSATSLNRQDIAIDFPNAYTSQRADLIAGKGVRAQIDGKQYDPQQPMIYKWSMDIDQQLGSNTTVGVGYSGTRGTHLFRQVQLNVTPATFVNGRRFFLINQDLPNPNANRIRWSIFDAASAYHGLRLSFNRRFSRGLQFQTSFTYSKSTDDWSTWVRATDLTASNRGGYGTEKAHGLSGFDIRRVLYMNFVYDLPGANWEGMAGKFLGGWNMSGVLRLQDGNPFSLNSDRPRSGTRQLQNVDGSTLDLIPGGNADPIRPRNPVQYYDPSQFLFPTPFFEGTLGKNHITAPGVATFDTTLMKNIPLWSESRRLQFQAQFFNIFNRANFGLPQVQVFDRNGVVRPDAGQITNTRTGPRQIQLGLKFIF